MVADVEALALLDAAAPDAAPMAARESLLEYVHQTFPGNYSEAPHHAMIVDHLEQVERGDLTRLMVFAPPQSGKSEIVSVRFPAWLHGRHPDWGVMGFSHTASLAVDFSRQVREQVADPAWPFPGVRLKDGQSTVSEWSIHGRRGRHYAAGVGGGGVGKGSMVAIIDDPFKNDSEAFSKDYRDKVYRWFWNVVRTRMAPGGRIVLMHQRWHEDDLAGRLLRDMDNGGEEWKVLTFPERAAHGVPDSLGRRAGRYLWPAVRPASETNAIRKFQAATWHPLYQQTPGAAAGNMIKRKWLKWRYDPRVLPVFNRLVIVVDSAFSEDVSADWSVAALWGETATHYHLVDVWRDRVAFPALLEAIKSFYAKWQHLGPWVYIENKASGIDAIAMLAADSKIPVVPFEPGRSSKVSRVQSVTPIIGAGRVLLPEGAPFLFDWIEEHVKFPTGDDDQVDTTSMALKILSGSGPAWEVYEDD